MNRQSLIGYRNGQGFIYNLSAVSKLLFLLAFSVVAMVTYDTRLILCIAVFSLSLFKLSGIRYRDVSFVLFFTTVFALLNALMVYLFAPNLWRDFIWSRDRFVVGDWDLFYYEPATILSAQFVIEIFLYCSCCFDFFNDHSSQSVCIKFE